MHLKLHAYTFHMQIINPSAPIKTTRGAAATRAATLVLIAAILLLVPIPLLDATAVQAGAALLAGLPALLPQNEAELTAALLLACLLTWGFARPADGCLPRRAVMAMVAIILVDVRIPLLGGSMAEAGLALLAQMEGLLPKDASEVALALLLAVLAVSVSPGRGRRQL